MSSGERVLEGGCHCGRVRFSVVVASDADVIDCNCSICSMKGFLHLIVKDDALTITAGDDALVEYRFNTRVARHLYCGTCGVHPFYRPRSHPDQWDVNARCLDGDVLASFRVVPFDGQNWEANVAAIR